MSPVHRNVVALGFVSFFTDMASSMVTSVLPLYVVYVLHEGVDKMGYIVAVATFVSYAFRFVFGYLSDRLRVVKPFVVVGYGISAVTKPMLALVHSWSGIALLRGVERIGKAVRSASKDALISAYAKQGKSGATFGFHKTMEIAGELIGSIIAFAVLWRLGESADVFKTLFAWTLLPGIAAVVTVVWFVRDVPYRAKSRVTTVRLGDDRALLPLLALHFGFVFFMLSDAFFMLGAKGNGVLSAYVPLLVILSNLTQTLTSYRLGVAIDRFGAMRVLRLATLFAFVATGALATGLTVAGFVFWGLATVASLNAMRSLIGTYARNQGSVYGIWYAGVALFGATGAAVMGTVWQHYGQHRALLVSLAGLALVWTVSFAVRAPRNEAHAAQG